jgi:hypothetical protein
MRLAQSFLRRPRQMAPNRWDALPAARPCERIAELQRSLQPAAQSLSVSTKQTSNQVATTPVPSCFEAPSVAPEIVIGACSNLLSTKLSKSILVRALNRRGLADSMMALVMVIPMGEGIG